MKKEKITELVKNVGQLKDKATHMGKDAAKAAGTVKDVFQKAKQTVTPDRIRGGLEVGSKGLDMVAKTMESASKQLKKFSEKLKK